MSEVRAEEALSDPLREDEDEVPRKLGISALAYDTAIYGGTRVAVKSLAFLLVPLYAHFLTPSEFGVLELVLATMALIDVFIALPGTLARFFFDKDERAWRRQVVTTYFAIEAAYPAVLVGALMLLSGPLAEGVADSTTYATLFVIALADLYLTNIVDLPLALARLRRKPLTFAFYALSRAMTMVVFSVLFVAVWEYGIKGILLASLVSAGVVFVISAREWVRDLVPRIPPGLVREMLEFSWPTILSGIAFYALNFLDRFFVAHFHGNADTGLYGAAFRYSQVVVVGVFAFRMGWSQWHFSWLHTERHPQMVARGANYYFFAVGFLAALVSLWILPVFHLLMPTRFWEATYAVPPLALAAVGTGAFTVFAVGVNVTKRMRLLLPLSGASAALAVGLYFLLVPPYSFRGAAWATAISFAVMAIGMLVICQRIYPVPWEWRRIGLAVAVTVALCLSALALDAWVPFRASLPARAALTLAYPLVLVALGFFPRGDLAAMRDRVRLHRRSA
jgi:O-antigen/teichoic acid export membrane protein